MQKYFFMLEFFALIFVVCCLMLTDYPIYYDVIGVFGKQ